MAARGSTAPIFIPVLPALRAFCVIWSFRLPCSAQRFCKKDLRLSPLNHASSATCASSRARLYALLHKPNVVAPHADTPATHANVAHSVRAQRPANVAPPVIIAPTQRPAAMAPLRTVRALFAY